MWKPQPRPRPQPQPRRHSVSNKPDGWAAFDLKHRQKQNLVPPDDNSCDPFPPIVSSQAQSHAHAHPHHQRPLSSLLPQTQSQSQKSQTQTHSSSVTATGSLYNRPKHHLVRTFTRHVVMDMDAVHDIHHAADSSRVSQDTKISSLPVEPEWDGDHHEDLYLTLRQNAFTTFMSASQHSKAATNAFIRGDHFAAKQHSLKAQQQRLAAKKLNTEAAKEILSIRNSKNDLWKLDLHGLHAAEAIQVLKEHLQQIETQVYNSNRSLSPASVGMEGRIGRSSSLQSYTCMDVGKLDTQHASSRQRPTSLEVITGVGNHSRGQAALPTAVRGFLSENGYRFEELRPGVITVRPKYRPKYRITNW